MTTDLIRLFPVSSAFAELDTLQSEVNRLFDSFFGPANGSRRNGSGRWLPAMDLVEQDTEILVRIDLPGLDRDDVSVDVRDGVLTVSGERSSDERSERDGYVRVERAVGRFQRQIQLPEGVDPQKIKASFDRGVLELRIPKPKARQPHRIEIAAPALEGKAESGDSDTR